MKLHKFIFSLLIVTVGMTACSKDDEPAVQEPVKPTMSVELIDAPGDYEKVFIDVEDVKVKIAANGSTSSQWKSLDNVQAGVYDLLSLTGGLSQLLAENSEVSDGKLEGIQLVIGTNNSVVVEGIPYILAAPADQQDGLTLQANYQLELNGNYKFVLDFKVDESITGSTATGFELQSSLRLFLRAETGSIAGTVLPSGVQTQITATNTNLSVTTYPDAQGKFLLQGVPAGEYSVKFTPEPGHGYPELTYNNIVVEVGSTTQMNTVNFE